MPTQIQDSPTRGSTQEEDSDPTPDTEGEVAAEPTSHADNANVPLENPVLEVPPNATLVNTPPRSLPPPQSTIPQPLPIPPDITGDTIGDGGTDTQETLTPSVPPSPDQPPEATGTRMSSRVRRKPQRLIEIM